jgi:hypothetical protein
MRCGKCRLAFIVEEASYSTQSAITISPDENNADQSELQQSRDERDLSSSKNSESKDPTDKETPNQSDWLEQFNQMLEDDAEPTFDASMITVVNEETEYFDAQSQTLESQSVTIDSQIKQDQQDTDKEIKKVDAKDGSTLVKYSDRFKQPRSEGFQAAASPAESAPTENAKSNFDDVAEGSSNIYTTPTAAATPTSPPVATNQKNEPETSAIHAPPEKQASDEKSAATDPAAVFGKRKFSFVNFLLGLLCLAAGFALAALLLLQLHQRQWIDWFNSTQVEPVASTAAEQISRIVALPSKTRVGELELVSAKLSEHPTRSATSLLQIRILNHVTFEQKLPSLQLTLFDTDGRIISRRVLNPDLYTHNNNTSSNIKARELKTISIELLDFPKNTEGYEIKVISIEK